ncbi:MAG: hypothetical protein HY331_18825 [Chloroflexi bacterium]|nr:hypothetical protein [Chloroflexota bacterium]
MVQRVASARRQCGSCRHYFPAPGREEGWCRHPSFRSRDSRLLVGKSDRRCARLFTDLWEPLPTTRPVARGRPATGRIAGTIRLADAAAPAVASPRRPARPPALPLRWALVALLAAFGGVAVLSVRLSSLADPLPTPVVVIQSAARGAVAAAVTATPAPSAATAAARGTPAASPGAATPTAGAVRQPSRQLGTYARTTAGGSAGLALLAQPGGSAGNGRKVAEGTILEVVGDAVEVNGARWRRLRDGEGRLGWLAESQLAVLQPEPGETTSEIGLMTEPRRTATRLARIPAGVPVAIIDARDGDAIDPTRPTPSRWYWIRVITTGEVGWAYSGTVKRRE